MFCKNCGHQICDDSKFCDNCGQKIENLLTVDIVNTANEESAAVSEKNVVNAAAELAVEKESEEVKEEKPKRAKLNKAFSIIYLVGFIIASLGVTSFLGIFVTGLIDYGDIHIYSHSAITIISLICMLTGFVTLSTTFVLNFIFKGNRYLAKKIFLVFTIILLVLSLGFSIWVFIDRENNTHYYGGDYYSPTTLASAYYDNNCSTPYATFGGSYIKIDTNPYNYDSDDDRATTYSSIALAKIIGVNSSLAFPSYVYQDMISTRALDGKQSYTGSRFSASWRYHPDTGLEVTYTEN